MLELDMTPHRPGEHRVLGIGRLLRASRNSNIRSADASPDWKTLAIDATCVSGWANWREYWMNAWTDPMRQGAGGDLQPPDDGDGDEVEVADRHHRRLDRTGHELGFEARPEELLVDDPEAVFHVLLAPEGLDDRRAR